LVKIKNPAHPTIERAMLIALEQAENGRALWGESVPSVTIITALLVTIITAPPSWCAYPSYLKGRTRMSKARGYLAKAKKCEERARKVRHPENQEWQVILARAYRMLAEAETELATRRLSVAA
jgi:hypothetical protein